MKWLLILPLLLVACGPSSERMEMLERDIVVLQAQYRDIQAKAAPAAPGALYFELTIGSFTGVHAYGAFSSYEAAERRVRWLKENGYMLEGAPYFIQPRHLDEPLVIIDAGGRP